MFAANACLCIFFIQKGDKLGGNPGKLCEIARTPPRGRWCRECTNKHVFISLFPAFFFLREPVEQGASVNLFLYTQLVAK